MGFYFAIAGGLLLLIALIFLVRAFLKPKGRRILFSTVSWLGFGIILPGLIMAIFVTVLMFQDLIQHPGSWWGIWEGSPGEMILYFLTIITSYLGSILMLLGGLIARPHHFATILLIIGICSIIGFYGFLAPHSVWNIHPMAVIIAILPGMACIIGSLILKEWGKQRINQTKTEAAD